MCGIAGFWDPALQDPKRISARLETMLDELSHRGPDGRGRLVRPGLALGMTRLAINDLAGGVQPYLCEEEKVAAVFNGEIYNFAGLRSQLERRSHRFRGRADGEVIVHLYQERGLDFVKSLNGMFAIALWDGERLHLVRDRMGVKPLYYARLGEALYFASELGPLWTVPGLCTRLDRTALRSYLSLETVPSPLSMLEGVRKLEPGHALTLETDRQASRSQLKAPVQYWRFPRLQPSPSSLRMEDWADRLFHLLDASVERRLLADVPLGLFLSGGLDSSALGALMSRSHPGAVSTFSVGFTEKSYDESSTAEAVARHLGCEHHGLQLHAHDLLATIPELYGRLDEPLADPALVPTYLLSKFARQKVKAVLTGEGADEIFAGYPTYLAHQLARLVDWLPGWALTALDRAAQRLPVSHSYLSFDFKLKRFTSGLGLPNPDRHLTWMGAFPWRSTTPLLGSTARPLLRPDAFRGDLGLLEQMQTLDAQTYLQDGLLTKLDRATMLASLEGRVPYLDHRLLEAMAELPTGFKLSWGRSKRVLRAAFQERLPQAVLTQRKKGFGLPLSDWFLGSLRPLLQEMLGRPLLQDQGLFDPTEVNRLLEAHLSGRQNLRKPIWTLLVFQLWWDRFRPSC